MKKVLLYSGGLDSYLASFLIKPDICLYVNSGSRYTKQELAHLTMPAHGELVIDEVTVNLQDEERPDLIVPQRNAFLILAAAYHGEEIYLGATAGDRSADKDNEFCRLMENLLNHMWQPQHWTPGRRFDVSLPCKPYSKAELVKKYLQAGGNPNTLAQLVSCYSGTSPACGACKPCARKWVALKLNGIPARFDADPAAYFTPEMIEAAKKGEHRGEREDQDLLAALAAHA